MLLLSTLLVPCAFAASNKAITDGHWSDESIWSLGHVASTADDNVDVNTDLTLTIDAIESTNNIWLKGVNTLIFAKNGKLTLTGNLNLQTGNNTLVFAGGSINPSAKIEESGSSCTYAFGHTNEIGDFSAATAKSIDAKGRLQLKAGDSAKFNLSAENLISTKSSGLDDSIQLRNCNKWKVHFCLISQILPCLVLELVTLPKAEHIMLH